MLSPIDVPPNSISVEEHSQITSSTPNSFIDIPPILRWLDEVEIELSPLNNGWEKWQNLGKIKGNLWVNEISVAFIPLNSNEKPGFNLPFPSLTLHALTPSSNNIPSHLYCQVDESDAPSGSGSSTINNNVEDIDEDEDEEIYTGEEEEFTPMREIRIFLNESKLESLFSALSFCSALHDSILPNGQTSSFFGFNQDQDEDDDDNDVEEGQWEDANEEQQGQGRVRSNFHSGGGPQSRFRPY
uniref:Chloride channel, nucleotide-sensitive, 1A n=1 Tax=Kwoniella pini CBS 10737 TaxID=1296096 RepID=A0A1B9IEP3_9TREE|nr:uncharacterized protein I206_01067 [Kwoniella pini CBS 10737]OCF53760.1 hypothetical protein I206_01067 [Kwoniella pini CBS 10737]